MSATEYGHGCVCDFIIVGAGAAGLAAARRLIDNNAGSVVVLEARSRLGGRTCTRMALQGVMGRDDLAAEYHPVEIGAEFYMVSVGGLHATWCYLTAGLTANSGGNDCLTKLCGLFEVGVARLIRDSKQRTCGCSY